VATGGAVSPGGAKQRHNTPQALPLAWLIADRSYDADALVAALAARGTCAIIPPPQAAVSAADLRPRALRPAPPH